MIAPERLIARRETQRERIRMIEGGSDSRGGGTQTLTLTLTQEWGEWVVIGRGIHAPYICTGDGLCAHI